MTANSVAAKSNDGIVSEVPMRLKSYGMLCVVLWGILIEILRYRSRMCTAAGLSPGSCNQRTALISLFPPKLGG